ncbi:MAG: hypothetical protein JXR07_11710 [Reichenbachiella sp.]
MRLLLIVIFFFSVIIVSPSFGQITLMGDNAPFSNVLDGDFNQIWAYWREAKQSPHWTTQVVKGSNPMGLSHGSLYSMNELGIAESEVLNANPEYQDPKTGDKWNWSFGADLEYSSKGTLSVGLVFGEKEILIAEKVKLIGSDKKVEHFEGTYIITTEDSKAGLPYVRVTFYSEQDVKVYLHYVNIKVEALEKKGPELFAQVVKDGVQLTWTDENTEPDSNFIIYRSISEREGYEKIGESKQFRFNDNTIVNGLAYNYVVTRKQIVESTGSNKVQESKFDNIPPTRPTNLSIEIFDTEIKVFWDKNKELDISGYSVYRGNDGRQNMLEIAHDIQNTSYLDFTPEKSESNTYVVYAHDFSGNKSEPSEKISANVKAILGASFSDLILPIPIHDQLTTDVWGAPSVIPRDTDNGIEDPEWSYWGGRPVKGKDNKYHMLVTRWPANATKGHWEWPNSTVAHVISTKPTGPYQVKNKLAYDFHDGFGHNPDVVLLNDGTFLLYSLIDWEATLFKSNSMNGPWKRLGTMVVNTEGADEKPERFYRFYRNLSGVQLDDDRFLFVTKGGAMMISENRDPLGPYEVLTSPIQGNQIIPEKYRNSNYEDPVIWRDEVQFHMIINAFWDYRAIYLRSPDGINWKFNVGTAYTPNNVHYEDGTQTRWYKLERPHVLQDKYGRATHLSLAVIDVPKADDLAKDNHSSKNIMIPLIVHKRLQVLNREKVSSLTSKIKILVHSEKGFDAQKDINISSIKFGASEEVDFGKGARVVNTKNKGEDLILEFEGAESGLTETNFVGKLLGKTKQGELLIGYVNVEPNRASIE